MRLTDLKKRLETIIRKQGNLRIRVVNSQGEVDEFTIAGFTNPDLEESICLIISNTDRELMNAPQPEVKPDDQADQTESV